MGGGFTPTAAKRRLRQAALQHAPLSNEKTARKNERALQLLQRSLAWPPLATKPTALNPEKQVQAATAAKRRLYMIY
jgi:hypothetical protein